MTMRLTLITPPDIFQNNQESVMLIDITEKEQDIITQFLGAVDTDEHINVYFYQGELNAPWFLHALACAQHKYINLDNMSAVTAHLASYTLSKSGVYYNTSDTYKRELYSHINVNAVTDITEFLERIFSGKK